MHSILALKVSFEGVRPAEFNQRLDNKRVPPEYGLVHRQSIPAVDAGSAFFHEEVEYVEVEVATGGEELEDCIPLVHEDVHIVQVLVNQLPHCLVVRQLASQVERRR